MKLTKIPRNIFQTWETKDISDGFKSLTQTWREKNVNYAYFLYDNNERISFIKKHFEEKVYNAYNRIIPGAFRADLWRYCILYIYGGVYIDIDTICYGNIDNFLDEHIEFMTPIDLNNSPYLGTYNLSNGFIASVAKHPILLNCIERVVYNVENNIVPFSNLDFSGPGVLGKSTNRFLNLNEEVSFIGKQGITNNIKFLKFEPQIEYVKDIENNNILFQNKNGNLNIQQIYDNEIKRINYVCWGTCNNPIKQTNVVKNLVDSEREPTIVTMFYNIREKEGNKTNSPLNRGIKKYCDLAKEFILNLPYNLIVFTDNDEVIEFVNAERINFKNKTYIYNKKFEDTYYYKYLDTLENLQKKFHIINGDVKQETPMYIILNNNKFDFIESAIELNPFSSRHFIWMDFGINHVAQNTEIIHQWINIVPDKIKQMCINPYLENIENKKMFQYIYHHTAGGLFSGSIENMKRYSELFKTKTAEIYSEEWYQIDEAVMTMVQRENPDLFDLFYGDYQGIISNFNSPFHNISLILTGCQKCIDYNDLKKAYDILVYCLPYFLNNSNNGIAFYFIELNLKTNYINNNNLLLEEIINLINLKRTSTAEWQRDLIYNILENYKVYIDNYVNKERIL